ncbi:hypothetical protein Q0590_26055 [Rhodocytophaga aerolata]|uniref:Uncharacterized protein n=1 Tax=Rhodocytophaga aerolata TaxID=455078 RepID=A0ABT8REK0_9BACT|nr:hypothetical protein [Rhodocytophaga aerolata]MDO1449769.1 hypothetical protein [Rhodocytophaga aerolata]
MGRTERPQALLLEREAILRRLSTSMEVSIRLVEKNKQIIAQAAHLRAKVANQLREFSHL